MVGPRAKELSCRARLRVAALLACAVLAAAFGCADTVAEPGALDAGDPPREGDGRAGSNTGSAGSAGSTVDAGAAGSAGGSAGSAATAGSGSDAGAGPSSRRCTLSPGDFLACGDAGADFGYFAIQRGPSEPPYTCTAIEPKYCSATPLPFATLTECLTECEPNAEPSATLCQRPGEQGPACDASAGADRARLEAQTPFGALHLTQAWLDRFRGFTNGITIHFTGSLEARLDARPSLTITVYEFGEFGEPHLIGEHELHATLHLCDRSVGIPVRMTVTADQLTSGASERFEATFESLAPDIELEGEVAFSEVCTFSTSL
jgi:hypothetical protein